MTTELVLADPAAVVGLGALARRVAEREPEAVLRVLARAGKVAVFAATPFDVLAARAARLADDTDSVDIVVEAATLAATAVERSGGALRLPADVGALRWTWPMPPLTGWRRRLDVPVHELARAAREAVSAFQAAVAAVPEAQRTRARLEQLAAEQWDRAIVPELPVRMAHAAQAHGFLGEQGQAVLALAGRWRRLELPYGTVLAREGGLALRA